MFYLFFSNFQLSQRAWVHCLSKFQQLSTVESSWVCMHVLSHHATIIGCIEPDTRDGIYWRPLIDSEVISRSNIKTKHRKSLSLVEHCVALCAYTACGGVPTVSTWRLFALAQAHTRVPSFLSSWGGNASIWFDQCNHITLEIGKSWSCFVRNRRYPAFRALYFRRVQMT